MIRKLFRYLGRDKMLVSRAGSEAVQQAGPSCQINGVDLAPYLRACRRRWRQRPALAPGDAVVLAPVSNHAVSIHAYAHLVHCLADRHEAKPATYSFSDYTTPELLNLNQAFGAPLALPLPEDSASGPPACPEAEQALSSIRTKEDLVHIERRGLTLGDLIHDTYLRRVYAAQVDLADPRLLDFIAEAFWIHDLSEAFFDQYDVRAVVAHHILFQHNGIVARVALRRHIPVYGMKMFPLAVFPCEGPTEDVATGRSGWPGVLDPFHRLAEIWKTLPESQQNTGLQMAAEKLEKRFSGTFDYGVIPARVSAYGTGDRKRIFEPSQRGRVIVMMSDFCDGPHIFRWGLFDDFYDWVDFTLRIAETTAFDWYVKPHPNFAWKDPQARELNSRIAENLKQRFPRTRFLPPNTSNGQILQEGVDACVTFFGSVCHEFTSCGVPVIAASDNRHVAFGFTHQPRTRDEYADLLRRAPDLEKHRSREDILAWVYMFYIYWGNRTSKPMHLLPDEFEERPDFVDICASFETLNKLAELETDQRFADIQQCLSQQLEMNEELLSSWKRRPIAAKVINAQICA